MECEYFEHVAEYQIAVCKKCRHGVLPSQILGHLQRVHRVELQQAEVIAERVGSWPGVVAYASEIAVPSRAIPRIRQLPLYSDGLMCQLDPGCCKISRSAEALRKHWKKKHAWTPATKAGRPN
jgi:hypothetical protein